MIFFLNGSVSDSGARTVLVLPGRQIVASRLFWVTAALTTPGVQVGSGSGCRLAAVRCRQSVGAWPVTCPVLAVARNAPGAGVPPPPPARHGREAGSRPR